LHHAPLARLLRPDGLSQSRQCLRIRHFPVSCAGERGDMADSHALLVRDRYGRARSSGRRGFYRSDSGSGSEGTTETTAHRPSHLVPDPERNYQKGEVAECTIRRCVRKRKMALRLVGQELFVPQSYRWGEEAQVDWYEAYADIGGERENAHVFCMRSMASGEAFHCAFPHASQQAFLEAHERAIAYFGWVFEKLRYDNLRSAVKRILRGHQREEIVRFIAFRSHRYRTLAVGRNSMRCC